MAWLERTSSGIYHVAFRYGGLKYKKSLRTRNSRHANARMHRVDENIMLLESGRIVAPDDADLGTFLLSDGKIERPRSNQTKRQPRTLREFETQFMDSIPDGSLERSTIDGMTTHLKHLVRVFGPAFLLLDIQLADLQRYVEERAKCKGLRGKNLSPATIRKEITTLRSLWNWARHSGYVARPLPLNGLRYPKLSEKPPFQTLAEIERKIARSDLSSDQELELWGSLFLTVDEIQELLCHVKAVAIQPFLYPMFVFAAHTGARRSEILRSQIDDIDFLSGNITIREKKRIRGQNTTRSVPISPLLREVLREWIPRHPGGQHTFTQDLNVVRSKKTRLACSSLTRDEAHDHFKRTMSGSRWASARGWHVFRHSFCSNCAAAAVDQRLINSWVGHQTEEMVKRYRHLIPDQQQRAIAEVFSTSAGIH